MPGCWPRNSDLSTKFHLKSLSTDLARRRQKSHRACNAFKCFQQILSKFENPLRQLDAKALHFWARHMKPDMVKSLRGADHEVVGQYQISHCRFWMDWQNDIVQIKFAWLDFDSSCKTWIQIKAVDSAPTCPNQVRSHKNLYDNVPRNILTDNPRGNQNQLQCTAHFTIDFQPYRTMVYHQSFSCLALLKTHLEALGGFTGCHRRISCLKNLGRRNTWGSSSWDVKHPRCETGNAPSRNRRFVNSMLFWHHPSQGIFRVFFRTSKHTTFRFFLVQMDLFLIPHIFGTWKTFHSLQRFAEGPEGPFHILARVLHPTLGQKNYGTESRFTWVQKLKTWQWHFLLLCGVPFLSVLQIWDWFLSANCGTVLSPKPRQKSCPLWARLFSHIFANLWSLQCYSNILCFTNHRPNMPNVFVDRFT